jgi:hypothetical protein
VSKEKDEKNEPIQQTLQEQALVGLLPLFSLSETNKGHKSI